MPMHRWMASAAGGKQDRPCGNDQQFFQRLLAHHRADAPALLARQCAETGVTNVAEFRDGKVTTSEVDPDLAALISKTVA